MILKLPMRTIGIIFAVVVAMLNGAAGARTLGAIKAAHSLKVGLTGDYAPYSLHRPDGAVVGADVIMAHALAQSLGVTLEIVPTTWKTMKADLEADRFDVVMGGVSVTPDRAAVGDFSTPVMHDGKRPIVRCADKERYTSIETIDRPAVRVVVNPGGTNERFAKASFPHASLREHADNRTIFEELVREQADIMVTDGAEVDYQARLHPGVLCAANVPDSFDHFDKAFWMMRDPALKEAVDAWLEKAIKAGDYERALEAAAKDQP
jgi:cyclohexadienyl dehydratase